LDLNKDEQEVGSMDTEEGLLGEIKRNLGNLPGDDKKEADRIANKMTQNIEAHVFFQDITSQIGKVIFKEINDRNNVSKTMVLLYPIVTKIINRGDNYLTFNHPEDTQSSEFGKDFRNAAAYDQNAYKILSAAIKKAITDEQNGERNRRQLGIPQDKDVEVFLMELSNEEKKKIHEESVRRAEEHQLSQNGELQALLENFKIMGQEEMIRLARTLYSETEFISYVQELWQVGNCV
jgi:hypothetical protein